MIKLPRLGLVLLASLTLSTLATAATAAPASPAWPTGPIKLVVPYPPGGSSDIIARAISTQLGAARKQNVIVDNRPGASGNMGADAVAKSTDGHTLLLCDVGALAIAPSVYTKLPFDPSKDLRGVTMLAYSPHLLVVHPGVPANNLGELVALSKTRPLNFAVTALGSAPHLAGVAVEQASGAKWTYIPYKGGAQSVADTMAGQTEVTMNGMLATLPHVQSGKLKVLAVSKGTRVPLLANVPTVAEQGLKGFESGTWQGVLAPASLPPAVIAKLNAVLTEVIRSPEVRERLVSQGAEVRTMTTAEFASFFDAERKRWAQVVAKGGVKLD
jgi:tripartite-type tricarboxylate transporter receptor subunit TctC